MPEFMFNSQWCDWTIEQREMAIQAMWEYFASLFMRFPSFFEDIVRSTMNNPVSIFIIGIVLTYAAAVLLRRICRNLRY